MLRELLLLVGKALVLLLGEPASGGHVDLAWKWGLGGEPRGTCEHAGRAEEADSAGREIIGALVESRRTGEADGRAGLVEELEVDLGEVLALELFLCLGGHEVLEEGETVAIP